MAMRIDWQELFNRGYTPHNIAHDKITFPWYDPSKKSIMYRAYRSWCKSHGKTVEYKAHENIKTMPAEEQTPDAIVEVVQDVMQNLAQQIAQETLKLELQKVDMAKRLLESTNIHAMPDLARLKLLEVLLRRG
ncbi:MAG: hypothetical protein NC548_32370 [Lachnospiraceae bacterium]|nr:hypothetical protein [Lachnospiraceae bacterium]